MDKTKRKVLRLQLSKAASSTEELLKNEGLQKVDIKVMLTKIKVLKEQLKLISEEILVNITDEKELENELNQIWEYEEKAITATSQLEVAMERLTESISNEASCNSQSVKHKLEVKLPDLDLIKFSGENLHEWPAFWEQFNKHIHMREELDNVSKFAYLKNVLTKQAAMVIQGLPTSQTSYHNAIELLKEEYDRTELIIDEYIRKLIALAPVKRRNDISGLKSLYNTAASTTRALQSLGVSTAQYGIMVKSIIIKALPYPLRVEYNKLNFINKKTNDNDDQTGSSQSEKTNCSADEQISNLLKFIKLELDSVQIAQASSSGSHTKFEGTDFTQSHNLHFKSNNLRSKSNFGTVTELLTSVKDICLFCKSNSHLTSDCKAEVEMEQKKQILSNKAACFRCTKLNHRSKFCRTQITCSQCSRRHASSMCDPNFRKQINNNDECSTLLTNNSSKTVYIQTACAEIVTSQSSPVYVRLVLDGGSQMTAIKESLSRQLNLPIVGQQQISIVPFGCSEKTPARMCNKVSIKLKSCVDDEIIEMIATEVPEICFDSLTAPSTNDRAIYEFASKYELADLSVDKEKLTPGISLLVGANNYWKVITGGHKMLNKDLRAIETKLGWTLLGTGTDTNATDINVVNMCQVAVDDDICDVRKFWDLETIGIKEPENCVVSSFTDKFIKDSIEFNSKEARYEVSLPWKPDAKNQLDSNFVSALTRFRSLVSKLIKKSKLLEYDNAMRDYFTNDIAELISENENMTENKYYMPHRPVYKEERETTKLRIVFDASSHAIGQPSLNESLYPGDNLLPDSVSILINFRIGSVALIADIEKAFLQILIKNEDRDYHSFLWFEDVVKDISNLPNVKRYRMKRVTFGVAPSPFLLAATLRKHLLRQPPEFQPTCDVLLKSFYVDDLAIAVDSNSEAEDLYKKSKFVLKQANMNLRKWSSNNISLQKFSDFLDNKLSLKRVLGIFWQPEKDELCINLNQCSDDFKTKNLTKRIALQSLAKIYDPLGFIGPFTVRAKIMMQDVWKLKLSWDEPLNDELKLEWLKWGLEIDELLKFTVPRCVVPKCKIESELHIFCDASPRAYGAVAYIKILGDTEKINCEILMSRNRVAPLNTLNKGQLTLPKLELTAAVCATRLQKYILENLNLNIKVVYRWTDSQIVLHWINSKSTKWKPYVTNRLEEIKTLTTGTWRHCPGTENPADLLTRGISAEKLNTSEIWRHGPAWLVKGTQYWPKTELDIDENESISLLVEITDIIVPTGNKPIMDSLLRCSSLVKLKRVTGYAFRFINNLKKRTFNKTSEVIKGSLTAEELNVAQTYWIRIFQMQAYPKEITNLTKGQLIDRSSTIFSLQPFIDEEGILRLGGRLQESDLPYNEKHPIILPKRCDLTEKIIWHCHQSVCHSGVNATLAKVRQNFWIIKARQCIKSTISHCVLCKKLKGKPASQPFAPMPRDRILESSPFKIVGIDFAGPLYVLDENKDKKKVYIMLITCATVRAVHIELVETMKAESCMNALKRFIARRGVPSVIYSDNAKTFKRVALEVSCLNKILRSYAVQDEIQNKGIKWKFIVERASWWGGFWERLVRSVKECLKLTVGKTSLTFEQLSTVLTEVENTINSRPLTYLDDDPENLQMLTPSHFLLGISSNNISSNFQNTSKETIVNLWKNREKVMTKFWKIWRSDYLQQLKSVHTNNRSNSSNLKVDDVAILYDQNLPRLLWKLVRVTNIFPGRDGRIRACEVKTWDGVTLKRPIQHIFPLEFSCGEDVKNTTVNNNIGCVAT